MITLTSLICSCISRLCTPPLFLQKDHVSLAYETNEPATTTHHRVVTGVSASSKTAFNMPRHGQPCRIPSLPHIFTPFPSLSLYDFRLQARQHTNVVQNLLLTSSLQLSYH